MGKKGRQKLVTIRNQFSQDAEYAHAGHSDPEIRPNDHRVLEALEGTKEYTFRGIMRKTGMHQETLSRSLRRLHDLGIVDRSVSGYKIRTQTLGKRQKEQEYAPILLSYLPPNLTDERIIGSIAGTWFKGFRWIGASHDERQQVLQWAKEDGRFSINVKVLKNHIIVETNADNENDRGDATYGAYRIIQKITTAHAKAPITMTRSCDQTLQNLVK